jgi:hypothetical protein
MTSTAIAEALQEERGQLDDLAESELHATLQGLPWAVIRS